MKSLAACSLTAGAVLLAGWLAPAVRVGMLHAPGAGGRAGGGRERFRRIQHPGLVRRVAEGEDRLGAAKGEARPLPLRDGGLRPGKPAFDIQHPMATTPPLVARLDDTALAPKVEDPPPSPIASGSANAGNDNNPLFGSAPGALDGTGAGTISAWVTKFGATQVLSGFGLGGNAPAVMSGDGGPDDTGSGAGDRLDDIDLWRELNAIEFLLKLDADSTATIFSGLAELNGGLDASALLGDLAPIGAPLAGQDALDDAGSISLASFTISAGGTLSLENPVAFTGSIVANAGPPRLAGGPAGLLPAMPPLFPPPGQAFPANTYTPKRRLFGEVSAPLTLAGATNGAAINAVNIGVGIPATTSSLPATPASTGSAFGGAAGGSITLSSQGSGMLTLTGDSPFSSLIAVNSGVIAGGTTAGVFNGPGSTISTGTFGSSPTFDSAGSGTLTLTGGNVFTGATITGPTILPESPSLAGPAVYLKGALLSANASASSATTLLTSNALAGNAGISGSALVTSGGSSGGSSSFQTDAVSTGITIYASSDTTNPILQITSSGTSKFITTSTSLSNPQGLAFSMSGNLYVANNGGNGIEKFSISGGDLGQFSNTGVNDPVGLAFDRTGDLFVANQATSGTNANSIMEFVSTAGVLSTTPKTFANTFLNEPAGIAVDGSGNVYVANYAPSGTYGGTITKITAGGSVSTFVNEGVGTEPVGVACDGNGNVYVSYVGIGNGTVVEYSPSGSVLLTYPTADLNEPEGLALDSTGNLYVANFGNNTVAEFSPTGSYLGSFSGGLLSDPEFLAIPIPVPEPGPMAMLLSGSAGFALLRRRRRPRGASTD